MRFVHDTYMLMRVRYASALIVPVCTEYLTSNCFFSVPKGRRAEMPQQMHRPPPPLWNREADARRNTFSQQALKLGKPVKLRYVPLPALPVLQRTNQRPAAVPAMGTSSTNGAVAATRLANED
ncbi:hypothetical protein V8C40DRAFT_232158 [Trichoderma camerunense]